MSSGTENDVSLVIPPLTSGSVLAEIADHVLVITLNRPEARNAVNGAMCRAVGGLLEYAAREVDVRVVVLTGAGAQAFCAGADLKVVARGEAVIPPDLEHWGLLGWVRHPISKPTICAVNGPALGGGTEIALAADLVVAAETATFGLPEVTRGLLAGAGGAFRIVEQVPRRIGLELLLTGAPISAGRALEIGLVNRVVPAGDVLSVALELAHMISANAPLAVQAGKRIATGLDDEAITADEPHWNRTEREVGVIAHSADAREGAQAFAEKRRPVWTGR